LKKLNKFLEHYTYEQTFDYMMSKTTTSINKRKQDDNKDEQQPSKYSKQNQLKEFVNQVENESFDEVNPATIKKLVLSFEKKYLKNQQMRDKFKDEPEKFMDSEIDLDEEIKNLQVIATAPELYPLFVSLGSILSLGSLIIHENCDISIDVIELFYELIQQENQETDQDLVLYKSIIENNVLETLIQNFTRLDPSISEESQAIYNTFGIIEAMLDLDLETISTLLLKKTTLIKYILSLVSNKKAEIQIKLYACEILSIVLQSGDSAIKSFGEISGSIESLLVLLSPYVKNEPKSLQETEMIKNIAVSLCAVLFDDTNKELFLKSEGIELMLLLIKKKTILRGPAFKIIDYAIASHPKANETFVQVLGLKTLFSNFMKKVKSKHNKKVYNEVEDEKHMLTIIHSLLRNLKKDSESYERLLSKFSENNFEKVEHLVELHEKYLSKVKKYDESQDQEDQDEDEEQDEDLVLLKRLDAGLFTLQQIDFIIALLCQQDSSIKDKVTQLLNLKSSNGFLSIKAVIKNFSVTTGEDEELVDNLIQSL